MLVNTGANPVKLTLLSENHAHMLGPTLFYGEYQRKLCSRVPHCRVAEPLHLERSMSAEMSNTGHKTMYFVTQYTAICIPECDRGQLLAEARSGGDTWAPPLEGCLPHFWLSSSHYPHHWPRDGLLANSGGAR